MRKAQFAAVFSLAFFALAGGCLILAGHGFTTSSKRGHWSVFVPAPQAYVMAAIMFVLSLLGGVWLLQQARAPHRVWMLAAAGYAGTAFLLTRAWAHWLH
ncbi:hypothetical protein [Stenotrophomonas sp. Y-13]|uniref:hypothetical protein n=1 Tax=Stenotrophomonas sp. Y-13 TaxID=3384161 RepID=UPI0039173EF7